MSHSRFNGATGMLALWSALLFAAAASAAQRPNILLIVSEDNGPALGCYGEPHVRTPVLDRLAAEGARFERAFVAQAGCSQSRASFLTGMYPHQHGQLGLATWKFRMYRDDTPNVVRSLHEAGYRTGIIGKLHVNPESAFPFDYQSDISANFGRKNLSAYAAAAAEFFAAGDAPFFLSVNYPDAHLPFIPQAEGLPAKPHRGDDVEPLAYMGIDHPSLRQATADYYSCMERLDTLIGDLLAALEASGRAENTLVAYIGDHGADILRGKRTCYEGGLRIPLIVRWPGKFEPGQVRQELVSTIDLMPTFLAAAGTEPPAGLRGLSLLPLLQGGGDEWREYLFAEWHTHTTAEFYPQRSVRNARFKLIQSLMPGQENPGFRRTLHHRERPVRPDVLDSATDEVRAAYDRMQHPPEFELYDLEADPFEWHNLAHDPAHTATLAELRQQLDTWRRATNDPLLDADNLARLKQEIDASLVDGEPARERVRLTYPDYFFRQQAENRPNVLFIAIDDLRPELGCYGKSHIHSPNIDRLAAEGTVFTRAYCQQAVCGATRTSLLTGLRPDTTRVYGNRTHFREHVPDAVTLPQYFKQLGYHTQAIGKIYHGAWENAYVGTTMHDPRSWSAPWWAPGPRYYFTPAGEAAARDVYAQMTGKQGTALDDWVNDFVRALSTEAPDVPDDALYDGKIARRGVQLLEELGDRPFFLAVGFLKPHLPFVAPQKYWDLYPADEITLPANYAAPQGAPAWAVRGSNEIAQYGTDIPPNGAVSHEKALELIRGYRACVSFVDTQVGLLLDALDRLDLRRNTIVILWGDHGWHLGEQGIWGKATNFENSTRSPLVVSCPGKAPARCDALVEFVDIYPALSELAGLPPPENLEGTSFAPLLDEPNQPWKTAAFSQWPLRDGQRTGMGYTVRTDRYRLVRWRDNQGQTAAIELYDHRDDPEETINLADDPRHASVVAQLEGVLDAGWRAAVPGAPSVNTGVSGR